jgi:acyl-coenzyme A thioesterase PaaI-like protein
MTIRWNMLVPEGSDTPPVEGAERFDPNDPFEVRAGPFWITVPDDTTVACSRTFWLRVQERHCNSSSIAHGGLLMTLADMTMADAARDGNGDWVTISFDSHFVTSGHLGDLLESTAVCTRRTGRTAFVRGEITSRRSAEDERGQSKTEVLTFSGVFGRVGGTKPARL